MTNIVIPIPPSLQGYREHLRDFISGMVFKLDRNSHKETPTRQHVDDILSLLRNELEEFEEQLTKNKFDPNSLVELMDAANFAFLAFIALRDDGVRTYRELFIDEFLIIDPIAGRVFCKKTRPGSQYAIGEEILGTNHNGYRYIKLQKTRHRFSIAIPRFHLVWWKAKGVWPVGVVDHINRKPSDDRIVNLRDVSFSENNANHGKIRKYPRFVSPYLPTDRKHLSHYGKFVYQRRHQGVNIRCGYYDTPEEANLQGEIDWKAKVGDP